MVNLLVAFPSPPKPAAYKIGHQRNQEILEIRNRFPITVNGREKPVPTRSPIEDTLVEIINTEPDENRGSLCASWLGAIKIIGAGFECSCHAPGYGGKKLA